LIQRKDKGFTAEELAELLPVGNCTVYRWIAGDFIPYLDRRIPSAFVKRLKKLWDKTCTPSEASRVLGVSTSKVDDMLKEGCFNVVMIVRKKRIFKSSLNKVKRKNFVVQRVDIVHPNRRGFARLKKSKLQEISIMGNKSQKRNKLSGAFRTFVE